MLDFEIL